MSYDTLIERLQQELGLDPDSIGALTLRHGIDEARAALDCASVAELYTRTCTNAADWHRFIDLMVVPETWFFRVPEQYADLVRQVRAIEARPLRILSLPCSTGEEPYSIAASLLEAGWAPQQFDILGVDVSEQAIQTAQRAVYRPSSLRGMAPGPWIELDAGQVQPVDAVRRSVRFLRANALSEHALPPGLRFHAIFCRNLLIYLDASSRARLLDLLIAHLQPGGLIYAGQAEALASMDARLCPAVDYGALTYELAAPRAPVPAAAAPAPRQYAPTAIPQAPRPVSASRAPAPADPLAQAQALADRGELAAARAQCEQCLQQTPESAEAWYLLGTIEMAARRLEAAEAALTRVSFLQRDHAGALEQRVALAEAQGRAGEAAQLRARLQRLAGVSAR